MDYYLVKKERKKGRAVFHARFYETGPDGSQRVIRQVSTKQTSEAAAHNQVKEWIDAGKFQSAPDSVSVYFATFWTRESPYIREFDEPDEDGNATPISELHLKNRHNQAALFIKWCKENGVQKLSDVTRAVLSEYRDWLATAKPSKATRLNYWRAVTIPIERAVQDGKLTVSPVPPSPKATGRANRASRGKKREAFDVPELLDVLKPERWADLRARTGALLALTCSLRRAEIRGLLWENVHPDALTLDVVSSWRDTEETHLSPPKWFHERLAVPVPFSVMVELQALAPPDGTGLVFRDIDTPSVPIGEQVLFRALRDAGAACETPIEINRYKGFHSLRHSYVSVADARIVEQRRQALRTVAGHNDARTQDMYRHVLHSEEERIAIEWDAWLTENKLTVFDIPATHQSYGVFDVSIIRAKIAEKPSNSAWSYVPSLRCKDLRDIVTLNVTLSAFYRLGDAINDVLALAGEVLPPRDMEAFFADFSFKPGDCLPYRFTACFRDSPVH